MSNIAWHISYGKGPSTPAGHAPCETISRHAKRGDGHGLSIAVSVGLNPAHATLSAGAPSLAKTRTAMRMPLGARGMRADVHHAARYRGLIACVHGTSAYVLCVPKAKMAARAPPTPPPRVTATGDSAGPIGHVQGLAPPLERGMNGHIPEACTHPIAFVREGSPVPVRYVVVSGRC